MNSKNLTDKTPGIWTMEPEEVLMKLGLPVREGHKTGSCIMPAPKHLQYARMQQSSQKENKKKNDTSEKQEKQQRQELVKRILQEIEEDMKLTDEELEQKYHRSLAWD